VSWRLKFRWLAGALALCCGAAAAQVSLGDFHATANGNIAADYAGAFGNLATSEHSIGIGGSGTIGGYYYNPQFVSFSVLPYYGRSQDNSESQSITDSSGYTGNINIFSGSHYPGYFGFHQMWNSSGTFGIPGVAGLTTENNNHGLDFGWSLLLPDKPSLSVGYAEGSTSSSLFGSAGTTESTNHVFDVKSGYQVGGFRLAGGFIHVNANADIGGFVNGETETTDTSSNEYYLVASRAIPYRSSTFSVAYNRGSYSTDDSVAGQNSGTTDNVTANVNLMFPKLPVSVVANYTDNIFGSYEQQLVNNGQAPLASIGSPESRSLSVNASTYYAIFPGAMVGGYVTRTEQYFAGQDYGLTQFGATASYGFARLLKGLRIMGGVVDTTDQQGNTRAGLIGTVFYDRSHGRWDIQGFTRYDQDTQTLLVLYTLSSLNYGGTFKYNLGHDLRWIAIANCTRSVFEESSGTANRAESFTSMLLWRRATVSANYSQAKGTSVFTASGLVQTPVPGSLISPENSTLYNGVSYGGTFKVNPTHNLVISTAYEKTGSNTLSPLMFSNNGSTVYTSLLQYTFRKVVFTAGATKFNQHIFPSSTPPSMLTSYSFGITRWFKAF
jgi:hypothetical protein